MPFYGLTHSLTFLLPTTTGQAALVRLAYPLLDMALLTMAGRARTLRLPAPLATTAARRVHLRRAALAVAAGAATAARAAARGLRAHAPVAPRPLTLVITLTPTLTKTLTLTTDPSPHPNQMAPRPGVGPAGARVCRAWRRRHAAQHRVRPAAHRRLQLRLPPPGAAVRCSGPRAVGTLALRAGMLPVRQTV